MKSINEIVDLASAYYGSAVLFAAIDRGVFAAIEKLNNPLSTSTSDLHLAKSLRTRAGILLYFSLPVAVWLQPTR